MGGEGTTASKAAASRWKDLNCASGKLPSRMEPWGGPRLLSRVHVTFPSVFACWRG